MTIKTECSVLFERVRNGMLLWWKNLSYMENRRSTGNGTGLISLPMGRLRF